VDDFLARQVVGQWQALGAALLAGGWRHTRRRRTLVASASTVSNSSSRSSSCSISGEPLGRLAELCAWARQLDLELLDLQRGQLNGRLGCAKLGNGAGQLRSGGCVLGLQRLCEGAQFVRSEEIDHRQRHGPSYHRADSGREKDRKAPFR
jgi:hypothetical protein